MKMFRACSLFFIAAMLLAPQNARARMRLRRGHHAEPRIFSYYPELRGSDFVIDSENKRMDRAGVPKIPNYETLCGMEREHALVPIPEAGTGYYLVYSLNPAYRFLAPKADFYFTELARAYYRHFGEPYKVTELVRTEIYQAWLARHNPNAVGPKRSLHVRGYAFDIGAKGMTPEERFWLAGRLARDMHAGEIWATFEHVVALDFHIVVFP